MVFGRKKVELADMPEAKIYQKPKPAEVLEEAPRPQVGTARIIAAELTEKGFRYVVISNKPIGEIGDEFPID